jgi:anti-anti-sigma regulatory factor
MPELDISPWGSTSAEWERLTVTKRSDATIFSPRGEIDVGVMTRLGPIVRNAAAWGADVVLDLSEVESLNARAIELLGNVAAEVQRLEGRWVVAVIEDGDDPVRFNLVATLASKLTTCGDVEEALALLREPVLRGQDGFAEAV